MDTLITAQGRTYYHVDGSKRFATVSVEKGTYDYVLTTTINHTWKSTTGLYPTLEKAMEAYRITLSVLQYVAVHSTHLPKGN